MIRRFGVVFGVYVQVVLWTAAGLFFFSGVTLNVPPAIFAALLLATLPPMYKTVVLFLKGGQRRGSVRAYRETNVFIDDERPYYILRLPRTLSYLLTDFMPPRLRVGFYRVCREYQEHNRTVYKPPNLWLYYQASAPALIFLLTFPFRLIRRVLRRVGERSRAA